EAAREHTVGDLAEAGQVGLAMRAPTLDAPAVAFEELVGTGASGAVAALDVRDPLERQPLEEGHHELVERAFALSREPAGEEERVHPVLDVLVDERLQE